MTNENIEVTVCGQEVTGFEGSEIVTVKRESAAVEELSNLAKSYLAVEEFKPGDIVQWKPRMMNKRLPRYGEQMVVLEVVPGKRDRENEAGNAYHDEDISVRAGIVDKNGDFIAYWYDAHRLTHCE